MIPMLCRCLLLLLLSACLPGGLAAQSRTPYQCAVRAVKGLETSFADFVELVHPVKGLAYHESGLDINDEAVFSPAQLRADLKAGTRRYRITSAYSDALIDSAVNIRAYLQAVARQHHFSRSKDRRRNITGLDHSTDVFKPAGPGQTLISFHLRSSKPAEELLWRCLVVRTEMYRGRAWVVGIDYLYWTP